MGNFIQSLSSYHLNKLAVASIPTLASIPGFGQGKAESFRSGFDGRRDLIISILAAGVTINAPVAVSSGPLSGSSICMTGFRDKVMEDAIHAAGGEVKSSVSKTLTLLVTKDPNSNSGKAKKARQYGVEVIGIEEMRARLSS